MFGMKCCNCYIVTWLHAYDYGKLCQGHIVIYEIRSHFLNCLGSVCRWKKTYLITDHSWATAVFFTMLLFQFPSCYFEQKDGITREKARKQ